MSEIVHRVYYNKKFIFRCNQYGSNVKLYGEVWGSIAVWGFKQEKLIECFFESNHNGTYKDIKAQIIDHRDPKDRKAREDFWIYDLDTLHPKDLNHKHAISMYFWLGKLLFHKRNYRVCFRM